MTSVKPHGHEVAVRFDGCGLEARLVQLVFPINDDIVTDVESTRNVLELVLNNFLKNLTG